MLFLFHHLCDIQVLLLSPLSLTHIHSSFLPFPSFFLVSLLPSLPPSLVLSFAYNDIRVALSPAVLLPLLLPSPPLLLLLQLLLLLLLA